VSGNLLKHPFLKKYKISTDDKNITLVHENGIYIGNNHFVNDTDLLLLSKILKQL
jgi:CDP-6-deoxy-D-xylo-4-hexulose-3-dehydrase